MRSVLMASVAALLAMSLGACAGSQYADVRPEVLAPQPPVASLAIARHRVWYSIALE
jgi:hypothetical protein